MRFLIFICVFVSVQQLSAQVKDSIDVANAVGVARNENVVTDVLTEKPDKLLTSKGVYILHYIAANFNYPDAALEDGIEGVLLVDFIVEKDGSVSNAKIARSVCKTCDAEAIRVIKSTTYQVFKINNEPQRVSYRIPVRLLPM